CAVPPRVADPEEARNAGGTGPPAARRERGAVVERAPKTVPAVATGVAVHRGFRASEEMDGSRAQDDAPGRLASGPQTDHRCRGHTGRSWLVDQFGRERSTDATAAVCG